MHSLIISQPLEKQSTKYFPENNLGYRRKKKEYENEMTSCWLEKWYTCYMLDIPFCGKQILPRVIVPILPKESPKPRFNAISLRPNSLSILPPIPPRNISARDTAGRFSITPTWRMCRFIEISLLVELMLKQVVKLSSKSCGHRLYIIFNI